MERLPKQNAERGGVGREALDSSVVFDLDKLPAAIGSEMAEQQLDEILAERNFEFLSEVERQELLKSLCEEFEIRWKLDPVSNNKFRFLAEAVAKRRFETDQLAQFLAQNSVSEESAVRFH